MTSKIISLFLSCILLSVATAELTKLRCSVPNCTKAGAQALCFTFDGHLPQATTCHQWADTAEGNEKCKIKCTGSCYFVPIYGSDGQTYCRLCDLFIRACRTKFRVTGPVYRPPHIEPDAVDIADRQAFPALQCSMQTCTFFGAEYTCLFKQTGQPDQEMSCGDYAKTSESQTQCQFVCTQSCSSSGPYDNERTKYCSLCHLQLASCERDYEIYGPYLVPGIELCSEEYCSANGDDATCVRSRFNTFLITCAQWKMSN